ncbi:MAG: respiratory nitrate reductase subunit gamma [Acidiferrobacteraceae bacterium]
MSWSWNTFFFGIYPFIVGTIFLVGTLVRLFRYQRERYGWNHYSSEPFASRRYMMWASNLFHVGILLLFLGHFTGFLTHILVWLHIDPVAHQAIAASVGISAGVATLIGGVMLLLRRHFDPTVRQASRPMDTFILVWLLMTLSFGLATQFVSLSNLVHRNVADMIILIQYVRSIAHFQPQPQLLAPLPLIYKMHIFCGMTVFLLFPFSRLIHILTRPFNYPYFRDRDHLFW